MVTLDLKTDLKTVAESMSKATILANRRFAELGNDPTQWLFQVRQKGTPADYIWEVNFWPHRPDYPRRRGGDFYIEVDATGSQILRELYGQ